MSEITPVALTFMMRSQPSRLWESGTEGLRRLTCSKKSLDFPAYQSVNSRDSIDPQEETMTTQTLVQGSGADRWDQAIYAFLAEKERRSGSMRTVRAYSGMLYRFFGTLGRPPDKVSATEIFSYAHGIGLSGKKPSPVTINARIACLSSFYRFLIRMSLVNANPCDQLERPRATVAPPRGLTAADIKCRRSAIMGHF